MRVLGYEHPWGFKAKKRLIEPVWTLCEGFSRADFISLHVPLSEETYRIIGWREIECFKPGARLY